MFLPIDVAISVGVLVFLVVVWKLVLDCNYYRVFDYWYPYYGGPKHATRSPWVCNAYCEEGDVSLTQEVNTSTVCRIGQETVEEIVSRTQEVFSILKQLQVGYYM